MGWLTTEAGVERQGQADDQRPGQLQDPGRGRHAAGLAGEAGGKPQEPGTRCSIPRPWASRRSCSASPPGALKDAVASLADAVQPTSTRRRRRSGCCGAVSRCARRWLPNGRRACTGNRHPLTTRPHVGAGCTREAGTAVHGTGLASVRGGSTAR
jgi:hypothetical protein